MDGDQADSVAEAVSRTAETAMAKVSLEMISDTSPMLTGWDPPPERRPGLRGVMSRLFDMAVRLWIKLMMRSADQVRRGDGFIDFSARRCGIDYGAYAELTDGSSRWSGRSGRALATLPPEPAWALSPLWLFDLLRGVTEASEVDSELVRGRRCQHLRASVDLARVSDAVPQHTPLPPGSWFEELRALPVDIWLDDEGYVRRIRFQHRAPGGASVAYSLELFDFGTKDTVDWSRLPLLKDPRTGAGA